MSRTVAFELGFDGHRLGMLLMQVRLPGGMRVEE